MRKLRPVKIHNWILSAANLSKKDDVIRLRHELEHRARISQCSLFGMIAGQFTCLVAPRFRHPELAAAKDLIASIWRERPALSEAKTVSIRALSTLPPEFSSDAITWWKSEAAAPYAPSNR
ncbi:hypothetical protein [Rhizobium leguminosarum]|uniref:hypothetical protein n=1 Tax=Rhizobium leguminosarum TaxID=384 RepID=UPI001C973D28|nr:hypothetical protein [Rhizobium leguminosarum]MBY5406439.1 hypothetical protein [Rhizobium leguminosarum]